MVVASAVIDISGITVNVNGHELLTSLPYHSIKYEDHNRVIKDGYGAVVSDVNLVSNCIAWFQGLPKKYVGPFNNEATRAILGEAIISEYRRTFPEPIYELFSHEL